MIKPSATPIMSGYKEMPSGKLLAAEDTPIHLQTIMDAVRDKGQAFAEQEWNTIVNFLNEKTKGKDHTGNDYLSMMATFLAYFTSTWLILMKRQIADHDEAGIGFYDLINPFCDSIRKIIETAS